MLNSWDNFFNYGDNDLEDETNTDLIQGLVQPERSLLYFRQEGAGIKENVPNTYSQQMLERFRITKWVAFRNTYVNPAIKERRVAVSQNYIEIESNGQEQNINVSYIPFANIESINNVEV